ncbi:SET domain-containing protein-lysine N-methyltransferase [Candidatus Woesearchaeota archaeon CG10_big_fil_rev_8_21_14_0_10_37_12]|nr:MAG: SET domain-containing protein-lysine N-methyltransferase [Candidatus Woesearchaeota archaeon CG10_big_fil_rev_8_21_14_0_10_37_12]
MTKQTISEWAAVKKSKIDNKGMFATKDIPKGTLIIEYAGTRLTKAQSEKRADEIIDEAKNKFGKADSVYIFELNKRYDVDGSPLWNTARYINHSCDPNCESDIIKGKIWVKSIRDIKKGEELSYDYGYDIDEYEDHPCKCGASKCVGYIVSQDDWEKLKRRLARKRLKRMQKN